MTKLTQTMLEDLPIIDIHVHLPGTISPNTAFNLGIRNKFITIYDDIDSRTKKWRNGPKTISINNPHEHYSDIFKQDHENGIKLDINGEPIDLKYDIEHRSFKNFDSIMATIQGHRYPPGGIQTEDDMRYVLEKYLQECIEQKMFYTEVQQNIKIAYQLYPKIELQKAREKFYLFAKNIVALFEKNNVHLRFLHCFNKTNIAHSSLSTREVILESTVWLEEASKIVQGIFVGIESAGHEKDPTGWPIHLKDGYEKVKNLGLGCEAHGGEGIGVEHMMDVVNTLPISRIAHGFQVIEDPQSIKTVNDMGLVFCMSPVINLILGACVHTSRGNNNDNIPTPKTKGGITTYITNIAHHPIFSLLRKYKCTIALCSDNPGLGGVSIKNMLQILSGLNTNYIFPDTVEPLSAEEIVNTCINSINSAFCDQSIKQKYKYKLLQFIKEQNLAISLTDIIKLDSSSF